MKLVDKMKEEKKQKTMVRALNVNSYCECVRVCGGSSFNLA